MTCGRVGKIEYSMDRDCATCNAKGYVTCRKCSGKGGKSVACSYCGGSGLAATPTPKPTATHGPRITFTQKNGASCSGAAWNAASPSCGKDVLKKLTRNDALEITFSAPRQRSCVDLPAPAEGRLDGHRPAEPHHPGEQGHHSL